MAGVKRVVIIGASAAGASAAEAVRRFDSECHLTLISDESVPLYSRCLLSDYLLGQVNRERLGFQRPNWPRGLHAQVIQEQAVEVDPAAGRVVTKGGQRLPYDCLVIATGASAVLPAVSGLGTGGVFTLYRLDQVDGALAEMDRACSVVVLGAGKIGVKAAEAVAARGLPVTLVEQAPHVLPGTLDAQSGAWMGELLAVKGIRLETGTTVIEVTSHGARVAEVVLDSGRRVPCDLLLVAVGARPNADLAREAGIEVRQGILVNACMETSVEGICAAGDVAEAPMLPSGEPGLQANWLNAVQQGRIAGCNLTGQWVHYTGSVRANAFRLVGLPIISVGEVDAAGSDSRGRFDRKARVYRRLMFRDGRLIGAIQVGGDVTDVGILSSLIKWGGEVGELQEALFADAFALFASQRGRRLLANRLQPERV